MLIHILAALTFWASFVSPSGATVIFPPAPPGMIATLQAATCTGVVTYGQPGGFLPGPTYSGGFIGLCTLLGPNGFYVATTIPSANFRDVASFPPGVIMFTDQIEQPGSALVYQVVYTCAFTYSCGTPPSPTPQVAVTLPGIAGNTVPSPDDLTAVPI